MKLRNRYLVRTNPLTDLAVVTILEPLGGNGLLPAPETLGVRARQLGPRKEAGGLEDRAEGGADGAFNAVVDVRFHFNFHRRVRRARREKGS
jgi:hypothetical protein